MSAEEWREIPGWEGLYVVSDRGRVGRLVAGGTIRLLRPWVNDWGYKRVELRDGDRRQPEYVQRLVLLAFKGEPEPGEQARHGPAGPRDNSLLNLEWGTAQDNADDQAEDDASFDPSQWDDEESPF